MVRNIAVSFGLLAFGSNAFSEIVLFSPESIQIDRRSMVPGPMEVAVAIVKDGLSDVDAVDVIFGSDDVPVTGFQCEPNWNCLISGGLGFYPYELWVSAIRPVPLPSSFLLGTLAFDLTGLADGTYSILVDANRDEGLSAKYSRGVAEPLHGTIPIRIVPEPAIWMLLAAASSAIGARIFKEVCQ